MADPTELLEEYGEEDDAVCSQGDLLDFQQAILDLCAENADLPLIGLIGALHTAAHVLTSTAFDVSDDELDEGEEIDEELLGGDGPLAVSYAVDDDTDEG